MKADFNNLGYIGYIGHSTARFSDEWYTPALYIESVRAVLREIDLEPIRKPLLSPHIGDKDSRRGINDA